MMPGIVYRRRSSSSVPSRPEPQLIIRRLAQHNKSLDNLHHHHLHDGSEEEETVPLVSVIDDKDAKAARWRNYRTRCFWGAIMITIFTGLLMAGHLAMVLMVISIQTLIFKEVIGIAHMKYKERKLPWFRTINWCIPVIKTR